MPAELLSPHMIGACGGDDVVLISALRAQRRRTNRNGVDGGKCSEKSRRATPRHVGRGTAGSGRLGGARIVLTQS